jgi:hypothetical protein
MGRVYEPCPECEYPEADVIRCVRLPGLVQRLVVCRACGFDWLHLEDVTAASSLSPGDADGGRDTHDREG